MELNNQFSKEQLIGHAQRRCEVMEEIIADPSTDPVSCDYYRREVVMGKIALAALTAEPVAWTDEQELREVRRVGFGEMFSVEPISLNADMCRVIPLYRHAQPAPVVPEELKYEDVEYPHTFNPGTQYAYQQGWNACRAVMLKGGAK